MIQLRNRITGHEVRKKKPGRRIVLYLVILDGVVSIVSLIIYLIWLVL